ncbi:MAG TPA: AraC family transcriptional regulator [Chthonomonadaceae bacterium]|nr:AraC family transcriptional regulator [Chthonomonadaceae bacterium]
MKNADRNNFQDAITRLMDVIALTLDERMDGEHLASGACLSRFHFQREFRRRLGETPGAFRRRLLLERAAHALSNTRTDITSLAFDAGFESLEGFSRAFRRAYTVSPSHFRRIAPSEYRLPAVNGIHFDPTRRGITSLREKGTIPMDLTTRLMEHDAWLTRRLLERARELTDAQLDAPLQMPSQPLPFESPQGTLRSILDKLVGTKEVWVAALRGDEMPGNQDTTLAGMLTRMETSFAAFKEMVNEVRTESKWDETFVDALCVPAETFTYGGMIAHVVTYSAYRRLTALKVMEGMGISGLGFGDPIEWERTV